MPSEHWKRVRKFMIGAGQPVGVIPSVPSYAVRELSVRLGLEELLEYAAAASVRITVKGSSARDQIELDLTRVEFSPAEGPADLVHMADGLADRSVVTMWAMNACGIDDEPLLSVVDENNLLKVERGTIDKDTGKLIKPPDHPKPDVAGVLHRQPPLED